ncbi:uncharacterized protein LOC127721060 [Mytilus californianus]|uniref:uncharacterized protein LOC127721060 n=1 Tax=Mytilus californianus TaxID=6549 RepID=UPI0022453EA9|nr:uncharacterized protein LOC127721060 [Mytilus californianus]
MNNSLIEDCTNGTSGSVSGSGWSNTDIFHKYLGEHFIKYAQGLTDDQPVLLIYDGHKSHVALSVIAWAKAHNIIILVLPAHCSHILQPLDVGCFGPLSRILNNSCHKYLREHREPINRYNIGKLATDAYVKALSPHNLKTSFEKTGIYPLEKNCVSAITLLPSTVFTTDIVDPDDAVQNKQTDHDSEHSPSVNSDAGYVLPDTGLDLPDTGLDLPDTRLDLPDTRVDLPDTRLDLHDTRLDLPDTGLDLPDTRVYLPDTGNITLIDEADPLPDEDETDILTNNEIQKSPAGFFKQCEKNIGIVVKKQTKKRKYLSNITSGKAITEDDVMADIVAHCKKPKITQVINKKKPKSVNNTSKCKKTKACVENDVKVTKPKKAKKVKVIAKAKNMSPKPGTSGLQKLIISDDDSFDDTCSIEDTDESPCCVCKKRFPEALRQCVSLVFAQWGKCMYPQCDHWTHLRFCCNVNVLRRHSIFYCPCHGLPCLQYEE